MCSQKIVGSNWAVVFTNYERPYYFNIETKETTWSIPAELLPKQPEPDETAEETGSAEEGHNSAEGDDDEDHEEHEEADSAGEESSGEHDDQEAGDSSALKKRSRPEEITDETEKEAKRQKTDSESFVPIPIPLLGDADTETAATPSSTETEQLRKRVYEEQVKAEELRYEEKVHAFKQMLRDKGVKPTDTWTKVQPTVVSDPRFSCTSSTDVLYGRRIV